MGLGDSPCTLRLVSLHVSGMGVLFILTVHVMRVVSYHVAFGCIHCITGCIRDFRNAYECNIHAYTCICVCISKLHTAYDCIRPHTMCCISPHTEGRTAYSCIQVGDAYNCIRWSAYMCIHVACLRECRRMRLTPECIKIRMDAARRIRCALHTVRCIRCVLHTCESMLHFPP